MKNNILKLVLVVFVSFLLTSCNNNKSTITKSNTTSSKKETVSNSSTQKNDTTSFKKYDVLKKVIGGADNKGIYAVVIKLNENAADEGSIELIYYGEKGSPQENNIVDRFRLEYYKNDYGTFEIKTYSNGESYQNLHNQDEIKFTYEFSASLRSEKVIIYYAPSGEEMSEIFSATADYFR